MQNPQFSQKDSSGNKVLTTVFAFQLLMQATADAIDAREKCKQNGIIQEWMNEGESIAMVLAVRLTTDGFEQNLSPKIMHSLLKNYCRDEIKDSFLDFYAGLLKLDTLENVVSEQFNALMDIRGCAIVGKDIGWKEHWNPFKEPFFAQWKSGFNPKPSMKA